MVATIINGKYRIALPDDVREALGLDDGAVVIAEPKGEDVLIRAANMVERSQGSLHAYAIFPTPTEDELDEALAEAWAEDEMPDDPLRVVDRLFGSLGKYMTRPSMSAAEEREAFETGVAAEVRVEGPAER